MLLLFLINAVFRGAGDAAVAMRVLWIANAINICLDPCFIFGLGPFPQLGVTGAAVATTTGRGIGSAGAADPARAAETAASSSADSISDSNPDVMLNMVRLSGQRGVPDAHRDDELHRHGSDLRLVRQRRGGRLHDRDPHHHVPASCRRGDSRTRPPRSSARTSAPGRPDRAEASVWRATPYNVAFLSVTGLLCLRLRRRDRRACSPPIRRSGPIATRGLRIIAAGFPFYAAGYVLTQSFNGAGDTVTPTLINLGCFWAFEIPLAYVLGASARIRPGRRVLGNGHRVFDDVGRERG